MSKEYKKWREFAHQPSMEKAWEAGRALGRREMKGECKAAMEASTVCGLPKGPLGEMYTRHMVKAIEAIPEEVGEEVCDE